jgi:hypothetical protein
MNFQWEEEHLRKTRVGKPMDPAPRGYEPKPISSAGGNTIAPELLPPFSDLVEIACQGCGGRGYDPGNVNAREPEDCPACLGSGKEIVVRNYLAEAFRIAADPETNVQLERAHLVAVTVYARQTVSALLMSSREVAS